MSKFTVDNVDFELIEEDNHFILYTLNDKQQRSLWTGKCPISANFVIFKILKDYIDNKHDNITSTYKNNTLYFEVKNQYDTQKYSLLFASIPPKSLNEEFKEYKDSNDEQINKLKDDIRLLKEQLLELSSKPSQNIKEKIYEIYKRKIMESANNIKHIPKEDITDELQLLIIEKDITSIDDNIFGFSLKKSINSVSEKF
jgi:gas vesicle protein